jgi:hypothetical protein
MTVFEIYDYDDALMFLKTKYGIPPKPYFTLKNNQYIKNKITRTQEGLFIHHDAENKYPQMTDIGRNVNEKYPIEEHNKEKLTYCNYLEHIWLHVLIHVEFDVVETNGRKYSVGEGGILNFMVPHINLYLSGAYKFTIPWELNCFKHCDGNDNWKTYVRILGYFIDNCHDRLKTQILKLFDFDWFVSKYDEEKKNTYLIKLSKYLNVYLMNKFKFKFEWDPVYKVFQVNHYKIVEKNKFDKYREI